MKKVHFLIISSIVIVAMQAQAQDPSGITENKRYALTQKKATFTIQPLQFFSHSLRLDFEARLGKGAGWLQLGPAIYLGVDDRDVPIYYYDGKKYHESEFSLHLREPYAELFGGGLDLNYKYFFNARRSLYVAAGVSIAGFNLQYLSREYLDDDKTQYNEVYNDQHIDRKAFNNFIGYQIPTRSTFIFDMFVGYTFRISKCDKNKPSFDDFWYSYGYNGVVVQTGFRIGFGLR